MKTVEEILSLLPDVDNPINVAHRLILTNLISFKDCVETGRHEDQYTVFSVLIDSVIDHFDLEERLMIIEKTPQSVYLPHKTDHDKIIQFLTVICLKLEKNQLVTMDTVEIIYRIAEYHMETFDNI